MLNACWSKFLIKVDPKDKVSSVGTETVLCGLSFTYGRFRDFLVYPSSILRVHTCLVLFPLHKGKFLGKALANDDEIAMKRAPQVVAVNDGTAHPY